MLQKLFICMFLCVISNCIGANPIVKVSEGLLRGKTLTNRKGNSFYSFQSIPFAQPPLGHLRFKAPVPSNRWDGIRDATQDLPRCYQAASLIQEASYEEDCLYLNVYTSGLPCGNKNASKPVMVFIHGGSFTTGSASQELYSPEFLLTEDTVLVVTNYRLGIFGSLSVDNETLGVPGNAGLKDQLLALKWVKQNINKFGGNPDDVTIFGESSGAASVHLHVLSPLSKGLFKKAIAQSGVGSIRYQRQRNNGLSLAKNLGIQTENLEDMLETLQETSAARIHSAQLELTLTNADLSSPIVEILSNEPAFLSSPPMGLIESGNYNNVTIMFGYNDAEAIIIDIFERTATGQSPVITDFFSVIPSELGIANGTEAATNLSKKIKHFYYGNSEPSTEDMQPFIQLYTDIQFSFPSYRVAKAHVKTSNAPIYFYRFSASTKLNFIKRLDEVTATYPGASHLDELGYLFKNKLTIEIEENSIEDLAIDRMVRLWTNFAKYGTPTPENFADVKLEPVTVDTFNYLDIGTNQTKPNVNPDEANMRFWSDIYEEYLP